MLDDVKHVKFRKEKCTTKKKSRYIKNIEQTKGDFWVI